MQDKKLRIAFKSLVRFLNLKVMDNSDEYYDSYNTRNNPPGAGCNVARKEDIQDLQDQIDKLKAQKKVRTRR